MRWRGLSGGRSTRCLHCKLTTKERPTDTQALTWRHVTHTMGSSPFLYAPVTAWEWLLALREACRIRLYPLQLLSCSP